MKKRKFILLLEVVDAIDITNYLSQETLATQIPPFLYDLPLANLPIFCHYFCRIRTRPQVQHSEEELERRATLQKDWTRFKTNEKYEAYQLVDRILVAQLQALNELRIESEQLYLEAIQPDRALLPFIARGPVATPPSESYDRPVSISSWSTPFGPILN